MTTKTKTVPNDAASEPTETPAPETTPTPADSGNSPEANPTEAVALPKPHALDGDEPSIGWTVQQGHPMPEDPQPYGQVLKASELPDPVAQREGGIDPVAWRGIGHLEVEA